uniref:Uncharacterized protein n=1 Tax=Serinus canaria TaxID=9135 RepID=A0A8C9NEN8_SERCA
EGKHHLIFWLHKSTRKLTCWSCELTAPAYRCNSGTDKCPSKKHSCSYLLRHTGDVFVYTGRDCSLGKNPMILLLNKTSESHLSIYPNYILQMF